MLLADVCPPSPNPGAVFSVGPSATEVITIVGVLATLALAASAARTRNASSVVAFGFILGEAVGNLIDRLLSPPAFGRGHVTDFRAYGDLFIGNLAGVVLGIGALLLFTAGFRRRREDLTGPDRTASQTEPAEEM